MSSDFIGPRCGCICWGSPTTTNIRSTRAGKGRSSGNDCASERAEHTPSAQILKGMLAIGATCSSGRWLEGQASDRSARPDNQPVNQSDLIYLRSSICTSFRLGFQGFSFAFGFRVPDNDLISRNVEEKPTTMCHPAFERFSYELLPLPTFTLASQCSMVRRHASDVNRQSSRISRHRCASLHNMYSYIHKIFPCGWSIGHSL